MQEATAQIYAGLFWQWEAICYRVASGIGDVDALMARTLPEIARWYIKIASSY